MIWWGRGVITRGLPQATKDSSSSHLLLGIRMQAMPLRAYALLGSCVCICHCAVLYERFGLNF